MKNDSIPDIRDYKKRLEADLEEKGADFVLDIITIEMLQRFYMCKDWHRNTLYSRNRVSRLHGYNKTTNFTKMCGCKGSKE